MAIHFISGNFRKVFLLALLLSGFIATVSAQTSPIADRHTAFKCSIQPATIPNIGLHVLAYPLENSARLKVKFSNATGREVLLLLKNEIGQVIYSHNYPRSTYFEGVFNLHLLETGNYTLQVSTLTKVGFIKHSYKQNFHIQSQIKRSISPFTPSPENELIMLQSYHQF